MPFAANRWIGVFLLLSFAVTAPACGQSREKNIDRLFEALQLKEGKWIADIGSREGFFTIRMAPIVGDSGHIFAVDIDADALEDLHRNIAERKLTNITPVYSVAGNPMLPAKTFDAILVRNTYHEFNEPLSMLAHIKKALKSDGRLVIAEPIDGDLADADRERQARSHDISMNYVKEDLKKAGYQIIEEQQQYSIGRLGDPLWLIVAQ
jgi:ubiquinone/menaquinone biosynthesis C-methylase UbiE